MSRTWKAVTPTITAVATTATRMSSDCTIRVCWMGSSKISIQQRKWRVMNQSSNRSKKGICSNTKLMNKNDSARIVAAAGFILKQENMNDMDIITDAFIMRKQCASA